MNSIGIYSISVSAVAMMVGAPAATAQAAMDAEPGGDIVVTAQKREQRTTDVPLSVTVLGARQLQALGITDNSAIATQVPGLSWGTTSNKTKPFVFMRGVGNADFQSGSNNPVGFYNDGVFQGNTFGVASLLMDLERVEILRGPQGTLWGKNTTGGLINYVPVLAKVGADANGRVTLGYGNFNALAVEAAGGIPLGDRAALRIAFSSTRDDGQSTSTAPATRGRIGGSNWFAGRASLAFKPVDYVTFTAVAGYSELDGQLRPTKALGLFDPSQPFTFTPCTSPSAGTLGTPCGTLGGFVSSPNLYEVAPAQQSIERMTNFYGTLKMDVDIGTLALNTITAYNHSKRTSFADSDFTPEPLYEYNVQNNFWSFSQETRLSSDAKNAFSWIVGLYYYKDSLDQYQAFNLPPFGLTSPANALVNKSENYAMFGDATWKLSDKISLVGGIRVTRDIRKASGLAFNYTPTYGQLNSKASALSNITDITGDFSSGIRRTDDNVSGRFGIQYHIDPNSMIYATVARGFKGGDVNSGALVPDAFVITKPEILTSYEGGFKIAAFDNMLQFNLAGFYYDYKDVQVDAARSTSSDVVLVVLSNAGKVRIYGFDGDILAKPTSNITINGGFSYINSKYTRYVGPANIDYAGNVPPYTSSWQLNGMAEYRLSLGDAASLTFQADASYRTRAYFSADDDPKLSQPAYALVNGSITYAPTDAGWSLRGWVKNIADKQYYVGGYSFTTLGLNLLLPGDRRTYGATASVSF